MLDVDALALVPAYRDQIASGEGSRSSSSADGTSRPAGIAHSGTSAGSRIDRVEGD
jgi:hypothetical protein